ncbi:hypothetical protein TBLA_0J01420 [Henningerozyma blattae CBS 6284]|uniref:Uncharacterized protein n=1 Tax=Henningerozyma blattae (strain ATCC 34711 / CBS 6284 / DSM 70876 / NBRC 10599 / NRRL Y-10934 / UCD 77-7) TaxID=1071380 RepID=I2H9T6_HENB6|nr:hypothetical protein TBLA_0J01420 [Tetrapisispora blattae CBS 6284]CCH63138.1 hypothetical protein TBLA_0J01420 [Tetrapisispora blattae CBS 6284]
MPGLTPINCSNAPPAAASYSHAMKGNGFIYVSGQIALLPDGTRVEGSISDKAHQIFKNISAILETAGSSLNKIIKVNIFLANIKDFEEFNATYIKYFNTHKPARSCVAVAALPLGADVEVEVVALE